MNLLELQQLHDNASSGSDTDSEKDDNDVEMKVGHIHVVFICLLCANNDAVVSTTK